MFAQVFRIIEFCIEYTVDECRKNTEKSRALCDTFSTNLSYRCRLIPVPAATGDDCGTLITRLNVISTHVLNLKTTLAVFARLLLMSYCWTPFLCTLRLAIRFLWTRHPFETRRLISCIHYPSEMPPPPPPDLCFELHADKPANVFAAVLLGPKCTCGSDIASSWTHVLTEPDDVFDHS